MIAAFTEKLAALVAQMSLEIAAFQEGSAMGSRTQSAGSCSLAISRLVSTTN
jgi:hypothetical protein